ncbi:MAG: 3-keto-5-aminohexanoate cleavage protein [bacterium]|nr:3-keto-5-aminohexanoate cleavage protein [bacterium]
MRRLWCAAAAAVACGCAAPASPPIHPPPASPVPQAARRPSGPPLIIEVALLPLPGSEPCPEAPATRRAYIDEIRDCAEIGASIVRLQPLAADSSPDSYRFDTALGNYRALLKETLEAAPDLIVDLDLDGAGDDVEEWARLNARVELDSNREEANPVTVAMGDAPLDALRRIIAEGGHVRLGLRDSRAWPHRGRPTTLDYLRQAIHMARDAGRPIAPPAEARAIIGLPPPRDLSVAPSASAVSAGDRFFIDAIAAPHPRPFAAYAVVVAPSGAVFSFTGRRRPVAGIAPLLRSRGTVRLNVMTVAEAAVGPGTPPGTYTIHVGLLPPRGPARLRDAAALATARVEVR